MRVSATDPHEPRRPELPVILVVLTVTTGLIDAISYIALGRVFTGFQTGNIVVLGFGLGGAEGFGVVSPLVSLGAFVIGATLGGEWAERLPEGHRRWFAIALGMEAVLIACAAVVTTGAAPEELREAEGVARFAVIALLGLAMGFRSATVSQLVVPGITTTVMTSTVTAMAVDAGFGNAARGRRGMQLATVAARVLGAAAGALLIESGLLLPFALAGGLTLFCAVAYVLPLVVRRTRARPSPTRSPDGHGEGHESCGEAGPRCHQSDGARHHEP